MEHIYAKVLLMWNIDFKKCIKIICSKTCENINAMNLERYLYKISKKYKVKRFCVKVFLISDLSEFDVLVREKLKIDPRPVWLVAFNEDDTIYCYKELQNIVYHRHSRIEDVIMHEAIHVLLQNAYPGIPKWLNEGIAIFETDRYKLKKQEYILKNIFDMPKFRDIEEDFMKNNGYIWSYYFVLYIIKKYRFDKIIKILRNRLFGVDEILEYMGWSECEIYTTMQREASDVFFKI